MGVLDGMLRSGGIASNIFEEGRCIVWSFFCFVESRIGWVLELGSRIDTVVSTVGCAFRACILRVTNVEVFGTLQCFLPSSLPLLAQYLELHPSSPPHSLPPKIPPHNLLSLLSLLYPKHFPIHPSSLTSSHLASCFKKQPSHDAFLVLILISILDGSMACRHFMHGSVYSHRDSMDLLADLIGGFVRGSGESVEDGVGCMFFGNRQGSRVGRGILLSDNFRGADWG